MNLKKPKILILVPHLFKQGGVALFYKSLSPHLKGNYSFFYRGNKSGNLEQLAPYFYLIDYFKFIWILLTKRIDFFVINTSLAKSGCNRDAIFISILKFFKKRYLVFFHGWNKEYEGKINSKGIYNAFPINQFKTASGIVVLAKEFKKQLRDWGFEQKIFLGKTVVEDKLIHGYSNNSEKFREISPFNFLFMARIEKAKGIMEALELFFLIQKANPTRKFNLRIGGNGPYLKHARQYVLNNDIENVEFLGYIEGKEKRNAFESAQFFLFPSYGEGMPLAVLEAMAFGLPMLVTAVGGLKDIFKEGDMGILIDSLDMNKAMHTLMPLINDKEMLVRISNFNYNYARKNFMSSEVANNLNQIILEVYSGKNLNNT